MHKTTLAALILFFSASCQLARANPPSEPAAPVHERAMTQLGQTFHEATDHATELVRSALQSLGVPYRLGGTSAQTGFDCSGFVHATFEQALGLVLPRRAAEQAAATHRIARDELMPGDLVFFNTLRRAYSHVGIYLGDGQFIHAPRTGARVRIESMNTRYWRARFNGARRAMPADTPAVAAGTPGAGATLIPAGEQPVASPAFTASLDL